MGFLPKPEVSPSSGWPHAAIAVTAGQAT